MIIARGYHTISLSYSEKEYHRVIGSLAPGGSYILYPITGTFDFIPHLLEEYFQRDMDLYKK